MGDLDLYPKFHIDRRIQVTQEGLQVPLSALPKETIMGTIVSPKSRGEELRCKLLYKGVVFKGAHGIIQRVERQRIAASPIHTPLAGAGGTAGGAAGGTAGGTAAVGSPVPPALCVKRPKPHGYSLCPEALLQWLAATVLETAGIQGAVPRVYDIFQFAGETRFTMDYIEGVSSIQAILESDTPERTLTHILAQTALLLGILQEKLGLDHRDLKADNLWIRGIPVHYRVRLGHKIWSLTSPFQVVLLDFGFACIGGADGNAVINLSDGVLPKIDPCPKEGRDLFQLLISLISIPDVRAKLSAPFQDQLQELLTHKDATYNTLIQMTERSEWSYLVVSDANFRHPPLEYNALLDRILSKWDPTIQINEEWTGTAATGATTTSPSQSPQST